MTQSVYVIGGAGTGKSTFVGQVMDSVVAQAAPLVGLLARRNVKNIVTFRGHPLTDHDGRTGLYVGVLRESFPGTDGLDRASSPVGAEWLRATRNLPDFLIAEGATLATRPFMTALAETTNLLVVYLHCGDEVKRERFERRGSDQKASFVTASATRASNLLGYMEDAGVSSLSIDTADDCAWSLGLDLVESFLKK